MLVNLPDEILLQIAYLVGKDSTLYLKPLALSTRRWHSIVSPVLLSTISVSSLNEVLELCDIVLSSGELNSGLPQPTIETHTKTIVIDGTVQEGWENDCYAGLEDLGYIQQGASNYPIPAIPYEQIPIMLSSALSRFVALDGLEWYGRFAGDYYLTQRLLNNDVIKHLTYGIERISSESPSYHKNAFLFRGLKTLTIVCHYESSLDMFPYVAEMVHHNPDIEKLIFDCSGVESFEDFRCLMDLIHYKSHPQKSIFVWPKLKHLVLESFEDELWRPAHRVDFLIQFLAAHPTIETLVLRDTYFVHSESETAPPLSLSPYPNSLPRLKVLRGSPWLIAGVLESTAACSSVVSIIDSFRTGYHDKDAKAPYVDRIIAALEKVPANQVRRLSLEIPRLSREVYAKFARIAPQICFLEFVLSPATLYDESFDPLIDIPIGLLGFPQLNTIGADNACDFINGTDDAQCDSILWLMKQVPRIRCIHCGGGGLLDVLRDCDGNPGFSKEAKFLDNSEYDWGSTEMSWRHRPLSKRAETNIRVSENSGMNNFRKLVMN